MSLRKKTLYLLTGLVLLLAGCKNNDGDVKLIEPKLRSFGFYAADNPGIIAKDYVVDSVTTATVTLNLPAGTDKTKLIARFTTNEGDSVKVNGLKQVSGVTANDFSYPVDYYLTHGSVNARYSVVVGKAADYVWSKVDAYTADSMTSSVMRVNPVTGIPYVLYKRNRSESAEQKAAILRFENGAWVNMGTASDGQIGSYYDLTFSPTGTPVVSFADYTAATSQMLSVSKFNGTGWELVGAKGVTTSKISYNALGYTAEGQLVSFAMIDATGGTLARRELCFSGFDGTTWTTNQTIPGRSSDMVSYLPVVKTANGALYVAVFNAVSPNSFSLYKLQNGSWTTLLDKWKAETATAMNIRDFDMDVDRSGNVYIAMVDNSTDGATLKHKVLMYSAANGTVSVLGNPFTSVSGGLFNYSFAVSPTGVPYLFYRNESSFPVVSYFDEETQEWSAPVQLDTEQASDLNIDFTPDGYAYASYLKNKRIVVYRLAEPKTGL